MTIVAAGVIGNFRMYVVRCRWIWALSILPVRIFGAPQTKKGTECGGRRERVTAGKAEKRGLGSFGRGSRAVGGVWHAESGVTAGRGGGVRRAGM